VTVPQEERERIYLDHLLKTHHQASQDFDKLLVLLASGALGLSVTFFDKIAPKPAEAIGWAVAAWSLLAVSLLSSLFSLISSRKTIRLRIDAEFTDDVTAQEKIDKEADDSGANTRRLDVAAVLLLVAGLAALIVFAKCNLGGS
jgi:hypothetical protein